jgi:hypothetical protein
MRRAVVLLALVAAVARLPAQGDPAPSPIVIRAGLLVDTETGIATRDQTIVVENGKISQVGSSVPSLRTRGPSICPAPPSCQASSTRTRTCVLNSFLAAT